MRFILIVSSLVFGLLSFFSLSLKAYTQDELWKMALQIQEATLHRDYKKAEVLLVQIEKSDPKSPIPSFGRMALYQSQRLETFEDSFQILFEKEAQKNEQICAPILKNKMSPPWDLFICGGAAGLKGFELLEKGSLFSALKEAKRGIKAMQMILDQDPQFKDAYLGLGLYNFWRSYYTRRLSFLPFFPDKRSLGLKQIHTAMNEGFFSKPHALFSLALIRMEEEKSEEAEKLWNELIKNYPENIIYQVFKGDTLIKRKKYKETAVLFENLNRNHPSIKVTEFYLGRALFFEGKNLQRSEALLKQFIDHPPSKNYHAYGLYYLGLIAEKKGDLGEAALFYKEAHNLNPDFSPPLKKLIKLRKIK